MQQKKRFWGTPAIIAIVFIVMALPYGLAETYGLSAKNSPLLFHVVSPAFSAALSVWWLAKYRQTSRNESEHDTSEGRNRLELKRKHRQWILVHVWARTNPNSNRRLLPILWQSGET